MPYLTTNLHLKMLDNAKNLTAPGSQPGQQYGLHWGDPEKVGFLNQIVTDIIDPNANNNATVLEIGPGGGRWTRYLKKAKKLYAVDYHQQLLDELKANEDQPNITYIKNNGSDFPSVPERSIDFVFSFGVFVHLDVDIVANYLRSMHPILADNARVFLQYSDKTKELARRTPSFSQNTPDLMKGLVEAMGYTIIDFNDDSLPHSAWVLFRRA